MLLSLKRRGQGHEPELAADLLAADLTPQLERLLGGAEAAALARSRVRVVQHSSTGRITLQHELDGQPFLYCKLFPDGATGAAVHATLLALWRNGFGAGARWRVVEPLGWLSESRALVTRAAVGVCLWERLGPDGDGPRLAARWLAELHATPFRVGPPLEAAEAALRLARSVARGVARNPGTGKRVAALVSELLARARQVREPQLRAQTHGSYNPWHVIVSPDATTALDLDNSRPADPATDLGEFVHWLRFGLALGAGGGAAADRATAIFLDAYARERPIDTASLAYHWSARLVTTLVAALGKVRRSQRAEERLRFYEQEFAAAPERARGI